MDTINGIPATIHRNLSSGHPIESLTNNQLAVFLDHEALVLVSLVTREQREFTSFIRLAAMHLDGWEIDSNQFVQVGVRRILYNAVRTITTGQPFGIKRDLLLRCLTVLEEMWKPLDLGFPPGSVFGMQNVSAVIADAIRNPAYRQFVSRAYMRTNHAERIYSAPVHSIDIVEWTNGSHEPHATTLTQESIDQASAELGI